MKRITNKPKKTMKKSRAVKPPRSLISIKDLSKQEIESIIALAVKIKKHPKKYQSKLKGKVLLMLFAKPSLRTHLSFEVAMYQLGGHPIYYSLAESVLGKKESIKDAAKVMARYVNIIMARLFEHKEMEELSKYSNVPVINHASVPVISGLDNYEHPCQVLGDLLTIKEKKKKLTGLTITYIGDGNNNVTNSLIYACDKLNIHLQIICPKQYEPRVQGNYSLSHNPEDAKGDILYTDTWFSYHVPESEHEERKKILQDYQVTKHLLKNALFMHCLPAQRGMEVTDEVMDSKQSIIYDQAENRLFIQKAILLWCLGKS